MSPKKALVSKRKRWTVVGVACVLFFLTTISLASLLGLNPGLPFISFAPSYTDSNGASHYGSINYDAGTDAFTAQAFPVTIYYPPDGSNYAQIAADNSGNYSVSINIQVDQSGNATSNPNYPVTPDLIVYGSDGTNGSPLLTGKIVPGSTLGFNLPQAPSSTVSGIAQFDMVFIPTGGSLAGSFANAQIGVVIDPAEQFFWAGSDPSGQAGGPNGGPCAFFTCGFSATPKGGLGPVNATTGCTSTNGNQANGLCVIKTANVTDPIAPETPVTYTYTVTNSTGLTLTNVTIVDDYGTPNDPTDDVTIATIPTFNPGDTQTFTATLIPAVEECQVINGTTLDLGTLALQFGTYNGAGGFTPSLAPTPGNDLRVTFNQSLGIVDNTYGTGYTSSGWGTQGHKFNDLLGSDQAVFDVTNAGGASIMDFKFDYISSASSYTWPNGFHVSYPSGYGTLGVTGGDGGVNLGTAPEVLYGSTTIDDAVNGCHNASAGTSNGYFTAFSPTTGGAANGQPIIDACTSYPTPGGPNAWNVVDGYNVIVSGTMLAGNGFWGTSNFGGVTIPYVHDSPSKVSGTIKFVPTPCGGNETNTATVSGYNGTNTIVSTATATVTLTSQTSGGGTGATYSTYTESEWGAPPAGTSTPAASLLYAPNQFSKWFGPAGLAVGGGPKSVKLTSPSAVTAYLPTAGSPSKITTGVTNPTFSSPNYGGDFSGQMTALRLNIKSSPPAFQNLKLQQGTSTPAITINSHLVNQTVGQILKTGNAVLGGGAPPPGVSLADVYNAVVAINSNYADGNNEGYLH